MGRSFYIFISKVCLVFLVSLFTHSAVSSSPELSHSGIPIPQSISDWIKGPGVACYSGTITLEHTLPGASHKWEFGILGDKWTKISEFDLFLGGIVSYFSQVCTDYPSSCDGVSISSISTAIYGTDFHYMNQYFSLYTNAGENKSAIVQHMFEAVYNQNCNTLSEPDKSFISSYFYTAANSYPGCPPPYTPDITWKTLTTNISQTITFQGSETGPAETDLVTICVRVSINSGVSYSAVKLIDIKPKSPTFNVSAGKVCPHDAGVSITVNGISGVLPGKNYLCSVVPGPIYQFTGDSYATSDKYGKGTYQVKLYYDDLTLGGCSENPKTITIDSEPDLNFTASADSAKCFGYSDGKITVSVTSGVAPFGITIGDVSGATREKLASGTYTVKVTDGCHTDGKEAKDVFVPQPNDVVINSVSLEHPGCLLPANGKISVSVSGGPSSYSYELLDGYGTVIDNTKIKTSNSVTFTSLPGGTYKVQAKSGTCGWKVSSLQNLTPVEPMQIFTKITKEVKCYGQNTGEIDVTASGGFTPYTFTKNNSSNTSDPFSTFSDLASGTYDIAVKSNGGTGCTDAASKLVTITSPDEIVINQYSITHVTCNGDIDGSIQTTVAGGTNVFSYKWFGFWNNVWNEITGETSPSLLGKEAGDYMLLATDSYNCSKSKEIEITQPDVLVINNVIPKDIVCFGEKGSLNISATGGTKNYDFFCTRENDNFVFTGKSPVVDVAAGEYYVKVRDAHGCEATYGNSIGDFLTVVTEPDSEVDFSMSSPEYNGFNIPCSGDHLGSISVAATGGNGYDYEGYDYSISALPFQESETFNNLPAGTFNIRVRDGRGCIEEKPFILTEPEPLSLTVLPIEHIKCYGEPTGKITVLPVGGIEDSYKYKLDGNDMLTGGLFEHLYAGTYDIEVSDDNGCRYNVSESVNHLYPPIDIVMLPEDVRCFDEGNGKINTVITGGSGGFTYLWDLKDDDQWNLLDGTADSRTNLVPGYYRIKATDSENCFLYSGVQINEPEKFLIPEAVPKDVVCLGEKGSINISATGGNGGNSYYCREKAGTIFESSNPLLQLPAGVFTVDAADKKGCLAEFNAELIITEPEKALDFKTELSSYTGYGVSCYGKSDGIVIFDASGGNSHGYSGYKYSVSGSPYNINNYFSELPKGLHTLNVTDGRGCIVEKTVELTEPPELAVNLLYSKPVPCFGKPTGEIAVTATGGIESTYLYTINGKEYPSGVFGGLYAGKHRIAVEDLNGCVTNLLANVNQTNPAIITNLSSLSVSCYGEDNGQISSAVTGGTGSFSINWEKKTGKEWTALAENSAILNNLVAGFYRIKARDSDDCIVYDSIEVSEPEKLSIKEVTIKDAACFDDMGSFGIEAEGGNSGYEYFSSADNGLSYKLYSPGGLLPAGAYLLKVTDSKGCSGITPGALTITRPETPLAFDYITSQYSGFQISCHGNHDGRITLNPSGGNGGKYRGYTFNLSGSRETRVNVFDSLEAGNYEISVTDGRGCRLMKNVILSEPESAISLRISSFKKPLCIYDQTGAVTVAAEGGTQPYKYSANDGFYTPSPEFAQLPVKKYTFRIKDSNGCIETLDTAMTSIISRLDLSAEITDAGCFEEKTGDIKLILSGGSKPYRYAWKDYPSFTTRASGLGKGNYTVTIQDSAGCKAEKTFEIKQPPSPLRILAKSSTACAETKNGLISLSAVGGTPPYRFAVGNKSDLSLANEFSAFPGLHKAYVSDANNCLFETSVDVVRRNTMPSVNFMLATSRYENDTLVILDVSVPHPDKVKWSFSDEASIIDTTVSKASVKYNQPGIYPVTMTGLFGTCYYSIEKLLNIAPYDPDIVIKDKSNKGIKSVKITPNPNDGRFELGIELYSKQQVVVKVFDLYSRLVFDQKYTPETHFREEIKLPDSVMPGTYVLWIISENDAYSTVFIISR